MLKIQVDDLTFGYNNDFSILPIDLQGLQGFYDVSGQANVINFPRSDLSKTISFYSNRRVRTISGTLNHLNAEMMIETRKKISGLLGKTKDWTIYQYLLDKNMTLENTYTFQGLITSAVFQPINHKTFRYSITIESDNPNFSSLDQVIVNHSLVVEGQYFNLAFPFVFGNNLNTFEVVNTGNTIAYPIVKLNNQGSNWLIKNLNNNTTFSFSSSLVSGQELIIDVKNNTAEVGGNNKIEYCSGIDNLILETGSNMFEILADNTSSATCQFAFYPQYNTL